MKMKLTNPLYRIDQNSLEKDLPFIRQQKFNRFIRRRVPFFMDGYRYAIKAVKERWDLDTCFFEAGHAQVMPVYLSGLINEQAGTLWWEKINQEKSFSKKLVNEVINIVKLEKKLALSIPSYDLTPEKIQKYIERHLKWWVKFFELGLLWFGVENIKERIDLEVKKEWKGTADELAHFLGSVYRPKKLPLSSLEQRDLLKLAAIKGKQLEILLKKHLATYRHLALHNIDDEFFDIEYYRGRLKILQQPDEYKKQKELLDSADRELSAADRLLKKSGLPNHLKQKIEFVRWFMYLRTETIDHMMLVNGAYRPIFQSLSKIFDLPIDAVLHMTYKEILDSLGLNKLSIPKNLILDRARNGYAYLIAPHGSYLVTGNQIDQLHDLVIPKEEVKEMKELKGQTGFKGKVQGKARVILDRRDSHLVEEGEILVTTMTSPEFVPAMKKSGGIITNEGGILCHAAIMSRELRKPCIIGTKIATDIIKTGQLITLDADQGKVTLH